MPLRAPKGFIAEDDHRVSQIGHPAPPWLVNYADLMTEMVAFFVILYALGASLNKDVQAAKKQVEELMKQQEISGKVEITREGLKITMQEGGEVSEGVPFFESGKAEITPRMVQILQQLSPRLTDLSKKGHDIIVEGHTDDRPISKGQFPSNWELSTARATVVVRFLIENTNLPANRLAAMGYGEHRPEVANDTEENRRINRRVVFFVKNVPQKFKPAETPITTE